MYAVQYCTKLEAGVEEPDVAADLAIHAFIVAVDSWVTPRGCSLTATLIAGLTYREDIVAATGMDKMGLHCLPPLGQNGRRDCEGSGNRQLWPFVVQPWRAKK